MKLNKEIRQLSRRMLQASFTDGQLDPGRIASLVDSVIAEKPRNYINVLKNYKRLLRLEVEKRHATVETASEVDPAIRSEIAANLKLDFLRGHFGIPAADGMGNQLAELVAIFLAGIDDDALDPTIDFFGQHFVAQ